MSGTFHLLKIPFWAAVVVFAAASVGILVNAVRSEGLDLVYHPPQMIGTGDSAIPVIQIDEAKKLFDQGAVFIDARAGNQYEQGHICCAVSVPLQDADRLIPDLQQCGLEALSASKSTPCPTDHVIPDIQQRGLRERTLVTYCDGEACSQSESLAKRLKAAGFRDVRVFQGGWPFWLASRYPVKGSDPLVPCEPAASPGAMICE